MNRYLLDTNILSDATKSVPSPQLAEWLSEQEDESLYISSWTIAEIQRGLLEKEAGKKRDQLEQWFSGPEGPLALFAGRILAFDESAALRWAKLMAEGKASGRPRSALDMIIAAVALANDCVIVTGNDKDFAGLPVLNPFRASSHPLPST